CELFFFFFQAEDGIRDKLVTGVQTCALPISSVRMYAGPGIQPAALAAGTSIHPHARADVRRPGDVVRLESLIIHAVVRVGDVERSEERRVGKECRYRRGRE